MTQIEKAKKELINTFATGDAEKAASLFWRRGIYPAQPRIRYRGVMHLLEASSIFTSAEVKTKGK